jgi:hypothetical protein
VEKVPAGDEGAAQNSEMLAPPLTCLPASSRKWGEGRSFGLDAFFPPDAWSLP